MKTRHVILGSIALIVLGIYGYKLIQKQERIKFLDSLTTYDAPTQSSWSDPYEAVATQNFDALERLIENYRVSMDDPGDGLDDFTRCFQVIAEPTEESGWEDGLKKFDAWLKAKPQSSVAVIVRASFLTNYAWDARGDGGARSIPKDRIKLFQERLLEAAKLLQSVPIEDRAKYPYWYAAALTCARGLGVPDKEFDLIYRQGVEAAPTYIEIHNTAAHFTMPQWGGSPGEWETNLRNSVKGMSLEAGNRVYAETFYRLARRGHFSSEAASFTLRPAKIDGERMIMGLKSIIEQAPDSVYFHNALAHAVMVYHEDPFACRDALKAVNWKVDPRVWHSRKFFDQGCGEWLRVNLANSNEE